MNVIIAYIAIIVFTICVLYLQKGWIKKTNKIKKIIYPESGKVYRYTREGSAYDGYIGECIIENGFVSLFGGTSYLTAIQPKSFKYLVRI